MSVENNAEDIRDPRSQAVGLMKRLGADEEIRNQIVAWTGLVAVSLKELPDFKRRMGIMGSKRIPKQLRRSEIRLGIPSYASPNGAGLL